MPSTRTGRWAGGLLALAAALFAAFFGLVASGERGGDTLFSNPALATTILSAGSAAVAGGCAGALALQRRDRSVVVILSIIVGALVALWTVAEIALPN